MNRGGPVDIVTGKPITPKKSAKETAEIREDKLAELAILANLDQSRAAAEVAQIVENVLIEKIESILQDDPACKLAIVIIQRIAGKQHTAKTLAKACIMKHGGMALNK